MKILAFAGSSSKKSINKQLVHFTAQSFKNAQVEFLDLNDYEMPLFSVDREEEIGPQEKAKQFIEKIKQCDLLVISLAEHNGSYSVAFKNILDWASRIDGKVFQNKPLFLMATSPGARGGASVLEAAKNRFPFMGGNIKAVFSLPEFSNNFVEGKGITSEEYRAQFEKAVATVRGL